MSPCVAVREHQQLPKCLCMQIWDPTSDGAPYSQIIPGLGSQTTPPLHNPAAEPLFSPLPPRVLFSLTPRNATAPSTRIASWWATPSTSRSPRVRSTFLVTGGGHGEAGSAPAAEPDDSCTTHRVPDARMRGKLVIECTRFTSWFDRPSSWLLVSRPPLVFPLPTSPGPPETPAASPAQQHFPSRQFFRNKSRGFRCDAAERHSLQGLAGKGGLTGQALVHEPLELRSSLSRHLARADLLNCERGEGHAMMMMGGKANQHRGEGEGEPRGVPWNREAAAAELSPNIRKLWYRH